MTGYPGLDKTSCKSKSNGRYVGHCPDSSPLRFVNIIIFNTPLPFIITAHIKVQGKVRTLLSSGTPGKNELDSSGFVHRW